MASSMGRFVELAVYAVAAFHALQLNLRGSCAGRGCQGPTENLRARVRTLSCGSFTNSMVPNILKVASPWMPRQNNAVLRAKISPAVITASKAQGSLL